MSSSLDRAVKDFVQILQESKEKGTSPYDTTATVTRVEDSIAWVHIPGGVEETPVQMTMNVNAGDTVQVRVSGGKAWIAGNATSPPTDDTVAKEAEHKALMAEEVAKIAGEKAENSEVTAKRALKIADDTDQYFWHMESGTDTGTHITEIPHDEFIARTAEDPTDGGPNLLARSGGMAVRIGLEELAQFSDYIKLGKDDESHAFIDYHSLQLINKEGDAYFHVSDLRDRQGYYYAFARFYINSTSKTIYSLSYFSLNTDYKVYKNGEDITDSVEKGRNSIRFNTIPELGALITTSLYPSADPDSIALTFGSRSQNSFVGGGSVVLGDNLEASGSRAFATGADNIARGDFSSVNGRGCEAYQESSHAEGYHSKASGFASHAEGSYTTASGLISHAEGSYTTASGLISHAEGYKTTASGNTSHAEGQSTTASGDNSHAQNTGTIAAKSNQTAIGKYNIEDTATDSDKQLVFIIGNGTPNARSNAFTIDWLGNTKIYASNIDRDAANPTSIAYGPAFIINDKDGERIATFRADKQNNDNMRIQIGVHNENSSKVEKSAWFDILVDKSGNASYNVPTPANFRSAIGLKSTLLTTTYTTNSYVTETAFNRIAARQYGDLVVVNGNLQITANVPKSSELIQIGKINLPKTAVQGAVQMIPCGTTGFLYLGIDTNGAITIYNYQNTNALGWCRFNCTLLLA